MTKKKRFKRYSPEFKREALMRASEEGVTDVIVCEELGIGKAREPLQFTTNSFHFAFLHSLGRKQTLISRNF